MGNNSHDKRLDNSRNVIFWDLSSTYNSTVYFVILLVISRLPLMDFFNNIRFLGCDDCQNTISIFKYAHSIILIFCET